MSKKSDLLRCRKSFKDNLKNLSDMCKMDITELTESIDGFLNRTGYYDEMKRVFKDKKRRGLL